MTFETAIESVLKHEGLFTDDPVDNGNWTGGKRNVGELKGTKYGISAAAYPNHDIKNMTREEAIVLYRFDYWNKSHCDKLPEDVRYIHFDTAVNMGLNRAAKLLQESVGAAADGIIGPNTLRKAKDADVYRYGFYRLVYYNRIIGNKNSQVKYINGWTNRIIDVVER